MANICVEMSKIEASVVEANKNGGVGIEQMPLDVKEKLISYLSPLDISRLLSTSRLVHSDISLARTVWPTSQEYLIRRCFRSGSERVTRRCFGVVVPYSQSDRYHSISLQCDWVDDSWTEQQAQLYIVSQPKPRLPNPLECAEAALTLPFDCDAVVAKSSVVRFYKTTTTLSFLPKPAEVYQLWCHLGLGSRHAVTLENITIQGLSYGSKKPKFEVHCPSLPINEEESYGQMRNPTLLRAPSVLDDQDFLSPAFKIAG
mmetsp:Transcript_17619/g.43347  ORF Transcript_17619/g.43347 Transcript_17619/m.43347 type:complete len:258 (+) Transcript_17619:1739-2512(+)